MILGFSLLCVPLAVADVSVPDRLQEARTLFHEGHYDDARKVAQILETTQGYILASEAVSAKLILGYYEKPYGAAVTARKLAEDAVALGPDNIDAQFQYAVAFGLETQSTGVIKAWRKRLPKRMLEVIEKLRSMAPDDPRGHALLGAWHLGIVNKVGERNAYKWYKASKETGMAHYEMALDLAKDDIVITSNYAASTISLGNPDYAAKLLTSVVNMKAKSAAESAIQDRMQALLELSDQPKEQRRAAKRFLSHKVQ